MPSKATNPGAYTPCTVCFVGIAGTPTGGGSHRCPLPPRGGAGTGPCEAPPSLAWFRKRGPSIWHAFHSFHFFPPVQFLVELPTETGTSVDSHSSKDTSCCCCCCFNIDEIETELTWHIAFEGPGPCTAPFAVNGTDVHPGANELLSMYFRHGAVTVHMFPEQSTGRFDEVKLFPRRKFIELGFTKERDKSRIACSRGRIPQGLLLSPAEMGEVMVCSGDTRRLSTI